MEDFPDDGREDEAMYCAECGKWLGNEYDLYANAYDEAICLDCHTTAIDAIHDRLKDDSCPCGGDCGLSNPCIDPHDLF